jgi:hypothetical protein
MAQGIVASHEAVKIAGTGNIHSTSVRTKSFRVSKRTLLNQGKRHPRRFDLFAQKPNDCVGRGEIVPELIRDGRQYSVCRHTDRLRGFFQSIFNDRPILGFANENPNGRVLPLETRRVIEHCEVELHFADVLGLEFTNFQLDRH